MATTNLSEYDFNKVPSAKGMTFGIVVSEWNYGITGKLLEGAYETLLNHGAVERDIIVKTVPGSFELTAGGDSIGRNCKVDAVICIGCIIRGETPHFDYICQGVTKGITDLNLKYEIPYIYGVLTTEDDQQAANRAGGKYGNKGDEAAVTAIKMVFLNKGLMAGK